MSRMLGPYALGALLGRGAMGEVWAATHGPSGRQVAIKRLSGGPSGARYRAALLRELRAVAALDHPGVLVVLDAGETDGVPWVVTELGDTDLARSRPGTWGALRAALVAILEALAHAHARGVLHRDVKPENVLRVDGRWKLADFGIAWNTASDGEQGPLRAGSPAYMAPEQIRGDVARVGPWSDLYAVGCVGWELASGAHPFARASVEDVVRAHLSEPVPLAGAWGAPPGYAPWLRRLLAKSPADRFRSAPDALHALADLPADGDDALGQAGSAVSSTWGTGLTLDDLPPADDVDETPIAAATPPPLPARWRPDPDEPIPRHGAEMALVGLRTPRLVGRLAERDALWAALADVCDRGDARLVVIAGDVGLGRTRLLQWLGEQVATCGAAEVTWRVGLRREPLPDELSGDRPRVYVLDDVDLDGEGLELVARVGGLRALGPIPALVVASAREPSSLDPALAAFGDRALRLRLEPLADADLDALARQVLRVDEADRAELVRRSAGNPRFAVASLAEAVGSGRVLPEGGRYALAPGGLSAPRSLVELGAAQVERTLADAPPGTREALELLAALELPAPMSSWERLCEVAALDPAAAQLAAGALLDVRGDRARLATPMIQAHLEATSRAASRWARWHLLAARHLERPMPARLGRHLAEAGELGEALPVLLAAVERSADLRAVGAAIRLRADALRALGLPEDAPEWALQWAGAAMANVLLGDYAGASDAAERALALARPAAHHEAVSLACRALSVIARQTGRSSRRFVEEGLEAERALGPEQPSRMALYHALCADGHLDLALSLVDALEGERIPRLAGRGILHRMRAKALQLQGELERARAAGERALAMDRELGGASSIAYDHEQLCEIAVHAEDWEAAGRHADEALRHHLAAGAGVKAHHTHQLTRVTLALARGDIEEARRAAHAAATLGVALGLGEGATASALAAVDLAAGHPAAARARLRPVLDRLADDAPAADRAEVLAMLVAAGDDDLDTWRAWIHQVEAILARGFRPRSLEEALARGREALAASEAT